ncbi:hypothetical protein [Micromonospora avicenniae]|uniref:hypothetical protein n=1 Tax=Micromonospora avicenniae TaxID=1198245 RepID=UPI001FECA1DA|nr:hypothetical protein [Micromonospora avicenniae]
MPAAVVVNGTVLAVADSPADLKQRRNHGGSSYPSMRLSALLTCGTRSVLGALFDPITTGEITQAHRLARSLRPGMLLLAAATTPPPA